MNVVHSREDLSNYLNQAASVSPGEHKFLLLLSFLFFFFFVFFFFFCQIFGKK